MMISCTVNSSLLHVYSRLVAPEDVGLMQIEAPRSWRMIGQSGCVTVMAAQADEATLMYVPEVSSSSMSSLGH